MASGQELLQFAEATGQNPYYVGYAIDTGNKDGKHDFALWNNERWRDHRRFHPELWHVIIAVYPSAIEAQLRHCEVIARRLGAKLDEFLKSKGLK